MVNISNPQKTNANIDNTFMWDTINDAEVFEWSITGFDVGDISEDTCDDLEGLDASAAHVANFLSKEPADSTLKLFCLII